MDVHGVFACVCALVLSIEKRQESYKTHIFMPSTENEIQKCSRKMSSFSIRIILSKIMKKNGRPTDRHYLLFMHTYYVYLNGEKEALNSYSF